MLPRNHLLEEESQRRPLPISRWNKRTKVRVSLSVAVLASGLLILAQGSQRSNFTVADVFSSTTGKVNAGTSRYLMTRLTTSISIDDQIPRDLKYSISSEKQIQEKSIANTTEPGVVVLQGTATRPVEGIDDKGPPVYAWYLERPKNIKSKDDELINTWKAVWRSYGYEPYVLGLDDARSNTEFVAFQQSLQKIFHGNEPRRAVKQPCYLRYLAMAAQKGGGMMVDLDTTPTDLATREELPDKFSLYCQVDVPPISSHEWQRQLERQYGTPCAGVGSATEWMRIAKLSVWTTINFGSTDDWTDFHSIEWLTSSNEVNLVKRQILKSTHTRGWDTCMFRYV